MKILVTRCTLWDMAGVAMIRGLENGLKALGIQPEIGALVFPENDNPDITEYRQFIDTKVGYFQDNNPKHAFGWCDIAVDLGGVCKGKDPYRMRYLEWCRELGKPYVYGAQSFIEPAPELVKGIPAVARGYHAAKEYANASGGTARIGADTSFLIEPEEPSFAPLTQYVFVTLFNKPYGGMFNAIKERDIEDCGQIIFKKDRGGRIFEPFIAGELINFLYPSPEDIFGAIATQREVHAARYHAAVAAIMADLPLFLYVDYWPKYEDLLFWKGQKLEDIRDAAMETARLVVETV